MEEKGKERERTGRGEDREGREHGGERTGKGDNIEGRGQGG